jgi:hypothetical protein
LKANLSNLEGENDWSSYERSFHCIEAEGGSKVLLLTVCNKEQQEAIQVLQYEKHSLEIMNTSLQDLNKRIQTEVIIPSS